MAQGTIREVARKAGTLWYERFLIGPEGKAYVLQEIVGKIPDAIVDALIEAHYLPSDKKERCRVEPSPLMTDGPGRFRVRRGYIEIAANLNIAEASAVAEALNRIADEDGKTA